MSPFYGILTLTIDNFVFPCTYILLFSSKYWQGYTWRTARECIYILSIYNVDSWFSGIWERGGDILKIQIEWIALS